MQWLTKYEQRFKPFTSDEAWFLFRLAAIGEAVGWTLLISGILIKQYLMHGNNFAVLIAGQIHGTLFIIYIVAAVVLYPSLGWKRWQAVLAGLASVPPYGSLLLEQLADHRRSHQAVRMQQQLALYRQILA